MKQSFFILLFLFLFQSVFSQVEKNATWFNETYRPQCHFTPEENRMGSPIGIMKQDTVYHFFYQWNPHNLQKGYVNWGYAVSTDLMKWKHEGIAVSQPDNETDSMKYTPWWGTVAQHGDKKYAWINCWGEGIFRYNGFENGKWLNWEKTIGTENFLNCEPSVFWYDKGNKWVMAVYSHADSSVNFLNSTDGLNWQKTSSFHFQHGFVSLTELPVDRKEDDTRWLLLAESGFYMLGKFDGEIFELLSPMRKFDYGNKTGGAVCFKDKDRVVLLSEMKSEQHPDLPSNGQLSFPTEITLHQYETGVEIQRHLIKEIEKLYVKDQEWSDKKIYPGLKNNLLAGVRGETLLIKGTIDLKNCDQFGFLVRNGKDQTGTDINYITKQGQMSLLGNSFNYKPADNKMEFEILVDRSSIEILVDNGRYALSSTFVPDMKSQRYELYTVGGEILVDHLEVHQLKSVWRDQK
ncbi:MAG TPA: GH32 C-terminal domain-containing protein [Prolixibacteraceae bacterium]|nr:GH32 C-terminal domain-containing protein [Prolixibacteraceae bacterium]HPS11732.1 GH32 C-terminal domain-containing protein [Prolixibacteraceae bacterium]